MHVVSFFFASMLPRELFVLCILYTIYREYSLRTMNTNLSTLWVVDPSKDKFWVVINEIQTSWTLLDLKRANIEDMTTKLRTLHKQFWKSMKILAAKRKMSFPPDIPKAPGLMFRQENELIVGKLKTLKLEAELQNEKWDLQILQEHSPKHGPKRCFGLFVWTYLSSSNLITMEDADISMGYIIWYRWYNIIT